RGDRVTIWQQVSEDEVRNLQQRADQHGGTLSLDDALSALRVEMTDELVDQTKEFWAKRGVTVKVEVEPEVDPTRGIPESALTQSDTRRASARTDGDDEDEDRGSILARRALRASRRPARTASPPA